MFKIKSITQKVMILISIPMLAIVLYPCVNFYLSADKEKSNFISQTRSLGDITANECYSIVLFADEESGEAVLSNILKNKSVSSAFILDADTNVFVESDSVNILEAKHLIRQSDSISFKRDYLLSVHRISSKDDNAGFLVLNMNLIHYQGQIHERLKNALILMFLLVGTGFLLFYFMKKIVTEPIVFLKKAVYDYSMNKSKVIQINEGRQEDELGRLSSEFFSMANKLNETIESLEVAKKKAEDTAKF